MNVKLTVPEALYYECEEFWKPGILLDSPNRQRIYETAHFIPKGVKSVADIGCGNGVFLDYLQSNFNFSVLGVDRSQQALKYVTTNKILADIVKIPVADQAFDCVTCLEVLEHIPCNNYKKALKELSRISSKYIIISVPYNEIIEHKTTKCPQCRSVFNTDLHFRSYDLQTLKDLMRPYGFRCVQAKNIVPRTELAGYKWYQKLLTVVRHKQEPFHSPICPVCSYENKQFTIPLRQHNEQPVRVQPKNLAKRIYKNLVEFIKPHWPMVQVPGYWAMALYVKEN